MMANIFSVMYSALFENTLYWTLLASASILFHLYVSLRRSKEAECPKVAGRKRKGVEDIPGPLALPIIGTRWIYLWRYKSTKVHEAYEDMVHRYGSIVKEVYDGGVPVISLSQRADIEKVLRHPSKHPFRPPSMIIKEYREARPDRFASNGLANEQGEVWQHLRNQLTPELISPKTMMLFLPELNVIGDDFIQLLRNNRDPDNYINNFDQFASRYGLETCCTLVLGERMTYMENEISETAQKLNMAMIQRFNSERDSKYLWTFRDYKKTASYAKFLEGEEILYSIVSEIVEKARKNKEFLHTEDVKCILMSVIEKPNLDEREKKSALIDFIAAGISTVGHSLIFLLYLVAKHPEVQQKVYEELEEIAPNSNHITATDLTKMAYTKACMLEAFRLIPVAFGVARILEEDMELSGYDVKAGTVVMCHTKVACANDEHFHNAGFYLPSRWLESPRECQAAATSIFAPFGVGKRMCPGKRFIEQALLVTFSKMIREFHIEFEGELDVQFEFVLSPKTPVSIRLRDRC